MIGRLGVAVIAAAAALLAASCGKSGPDFRIVAGSEQKSLEPIVQAFCKAKRVTCAIEYKGSLDIGLMLKGETPPAVDAVWPASSLWVELYDTGRRVKDLKSIAASPVILGVRMAKARELGWVGRPVSMADILEAVRARRLSFLMTSATQSNSGASAYLAMLAAAFGDASRLDAADLADPGARARVKAMLSGVARSSGSSGWLKDLYLETAEAGRPYDAMWNYEAVLKETNDVLRSEKRELLYAIYPSDGAAYADAPLGFVDRGQDKRARAFFSALQAHLLEPSVQAEIAREGRRTAPGMAAPARPERDWNFDPSRLEPSIALPEPKVIAQALTLYQEALRKPSLTALCLDFSGSMEGEGDRQLKAAVKTLFTPRLASESLIQWSPQDRIIVAPFDSAPRAVLTGTGDPASQARLLAQIESQSPDGGTDMYACAEAAAQAMRPYIEAGGYLPAVVLMTDGKSDETRGFAEKWAKTAPGVPIFGVTFGSADKSQLEVLAKGTRARVFEGGNDLASAFRSTRGYN